MAQIVAVANTGPFSGGGPCYSCRRAAVCPGGAAIARLARQHERSTGLVTARKAPLRSARGKGREAIEAGRFEGEDVPTRPGRGADLGLPASASADRRETGRRERAPKPPRGPGDLDGGLTRRARQEAGSFPHVPRALPRGLHPRRRGARMCVAGREEEFRCWPEQVWHLCRSSRRRWYLKFASTNTTTPL